MNTTYEAILLFALIGAATGYGSGVGVNESWRQSSQRTTLGAGIGAMFALVVLAAAVANGYKP